MLPARRICGAFDAKFGDVAMSGHDHDHGHHHDHDHSELSETELRVRALESILVEKG